MTRLLLAVAVLLLDGARNTASGFVAPGRLPTLTTTRATTSTTTSQQQLPWQGPNHAAVHPAIALPLRKPTAARTLLAQPAQPAPAPEPPTARRLLRKRGGFTYLDPTVVKASLTAVSELLISCGIGAVATHKGILDKVVIASLSKVVFNLLLPSLLVVNVARTVYGRPLASLLPLPMFATMQIVLCAIIARGVNFALRLDPKSIKGREIGVCSTFGNSGVIPILFSSVLLRNHPDPNVLPLAISYISFYLLGWSPIFWTVGYSWLAGPKAGDAAAAALAPKPTTLKERLQQLRQNPALSRIFSPPIVGCVLGLALGVSPLAPIFLGRDAPLGVVTHAVDTLSKAYASSALLVLAGSLALPTPKDPSPSAAVASAAAAAPKERTVSGPLQIASICLVRFLLCPLLFIGIVMQAMSRGFVKLDKLMLFILFLESCSPSAQNTVIIHSLEGRTADGTRLARLLLYIYVLSCVPLSILLTLYLQRFGL